MLIEFTAKNFRSIRDEQRLSMVASGKRELRESNTFEVDGLQLLRSAVLYGANASGKSNLLKAAEFMQDMVLISATHIQEGDKIDTVPFLFDRERRDEPSEFEMLFVANEVRYQYGFSTTQKRIVEEWLFVYPAGRPQKVFERTYNPDKDAYDWSMPNFKGPKEVLRNATRSNSLFLSTAVQLNNEQLRPVFNWFKYNLRVIPKGSVSGSYTMALCKEADGKEKARILNFLKSADLTISDVTIESYRIADRLPPEIPTALRDEILKHDREAYEAKFLHPVDGSNELVELELDDESDGTQKLFMIAGPWIDILENGRTLLIDELDKSLHTNLVKLLVDMINDCDINKNNGQLIFTTHNTSLLSNKTFRRDQVWFIEKDRFNATSIYPLSSIKARNDEALERGYLAGRYGGIPKLRRWVR